MTRGAGSYEERAKALDPDKLFRSVSCRLEFGGGDGSSGSIFAGSPSKNLAIAIYQKSNNEDQGLEVSTLLEHSTDICLIKVLQYQYFGR